MTYLLINTATEKKELALGNDAFWKVESWQEQESDLENLLPALDKLLLETNTDLKDLEAIYVIQGPGSFTALRLGITTANTLAAELKIPVKTLRTDAYICARLEAPVDFVLLKAGGPSVHVFSNQTTLNKKNDQPELRSLEEWLASPPSDNTTTVATDFTKRLQQVYDKNETKFKQFSAKSWRPINLAWQDIAKSAQNADWPVMPDYFKDPKIG